MAFTKCSHCGKAISDKAPTCPHCKIRTLVAAKEPTSQSQSVDDAENKHIKDDSYLPKELPVLPPVDTPAEDANMEGDTHNSRSTKKCPYCAEEIQANAIKCKHCGEFLDNSLSVSSSRLPGKQANKNNLSAIGILLHVIPWLGIALLLLWVGESPLITAGNHLGTTIVLVCVGTALLMALDANQLGIGEHPDPITGKPEGGPLTWFFGALIFWIFIYPMYMNKRKRYGTYGSAMICFIGSIIFVVMAVYTGMLINEKREDIQSKIIEMDARQKELNRELDRNLERLRRNW